MLAVLVSLLRMMLFYALYVMLCLFAIALGLPNWPVGAQMALAFGGPAVLVWAQERRRRKRRLRRDTVETPDNPRHAQNARVNAPPPLPPVTPGAALPGAVWIGRDNLETGKAAPAPQVLPQPTEAPRPDARPDAAGDATGDAAGDERLRRDREALRAQRERAEQHRLGQNDGRNNRQRELEEQRRASRDEPPQQQALAKRPTPARSLQGWVPGHQSVDLAGRDIGGMVYVGTPLRLGGEGYSRKSRPYIDPTLSVAAYGADKEGKEMPYWPGYSEISSVCRATYLDWLAGGRRDASYDPGYMFLYFYGLERRFFIDQAPEEEKREILEEVRRLASLYAHNGSAQRYLGEFIQIAQIAVRDPAASEPLFDFHGWELPFGVKAAIGTKIAQGEPLGWDWTLSWLICHPEHPMRTASKRCAEEFRALFRLRFEARFPEGLKVTKPRKSLEARYQAASQEFQADLSPRLDGKPLPDISGVRKPVEIAREIADEVTEALERFSRYLGRNPEGRGSLEAHALLPPELRALFPSTQLEALRAWASERVAAGGLVPATDVIARIEGTRPEKLTKAQLTGAADTLARIGFGLAPDPRFALRAPKVDEPLVIFALEAPVENLEDVSAAYRLALLELALGAVVVLADGVVSEPERQALLARIARADQISEPERLQLKANMEWHLAVPPDIALLRRKLKEAGPEAQSALRAALVAAAHADGLIQPEEVAQIEKLYRALGLDPGLVYSDIHAGDDVPVRVRPASAGAPGEPIPDQASAPRRALDPALIAAIRSDTARVSSVLGEIFGTSAEAQEEASQPESAASGGSVTVIKGLDPAASALVFEIINCTHLTEAAFEAACKRHGLMSAGALEAINEWAFETHDEALLDAYDGYDVSPQIAAAVRGQFAKEEENVDA
ncbi:Tellurite resistance protein [Rhodobacter capsulatus]|uniref:Tellurite resistance protein n=1 Tax=Rhodobacter capsulatus TaxID=1061 RepID=A0A1G7CTS8_RHOCA|nr:Tellurite resistance protein [Rhodobacter capsulatus]